MMARYDINFDKAFKKELFDYQSPIDVFYKDIQNKMIKKQEDYIYEAIQEADIKVDKGELIKALQYDRNQYQKGYNDGKRCAFADIEKEMETLRESNLIEFFNNQQIIDVVLGIIRKYERD